jgi:hypothetical protein
VHLYPAFGTDQLLEEAPYLPLGTGLTIELAAAGALPGDPLVEDGPDRLVALEAVTADQANRKLWLEI